MLMKKYCTCCFDVKEIVELIKLNGERGNCSICNSKNQLRMNADRIGRFLRCYLTDFYIDRKTEMLKDIYFKEKDAMITQLKEWSEQEGWQSLEEIFIEDKEIFSDRIKKETQIEILKDLINDPGGEIYATWKDVSEKRFIPRL